jgi:hypothetical protein
MKLGDVGTIRPGGWVKITTLDALGIKAGADDPGPGGELDYASRGGVEMTAGAARTGVEAPVAAATGDVTYRFVRAGAFVLRAGETIVHRISDLRSVAGAVLARYRDTELDWDRRWIVVTEVVTARPALVLIARAEGARATLRLRAQGMLGPAVTAGAAPSFDLLDGSGLEVKVVAEAATAVMWRGHHVLDPLLRGARFDVRGDRGYGEGDEDARAGEAGAAAFVELGALGKVR